MLGLDLKAVLPFGHGCIVCAYTQERFCNITVVFGGCLVAQHTVAEIWSMRVNFTVIFTII